MPCCCCCCCSRVGALRKLVWFGFFCPCHESEDEYDARGAIDALESLPIQWHRKATSCSSTSSDERIEKEQTVAESSKESCEETIKEEEERETKVLWLNSTLCVRDFPLGPVIQISSQLDAKNKDFCDSDQLLTSNLSETTMDSTKELVYWIPLSQIGKVNVCSDDKNVNEIVFFHSSDPDKQILKFRIHGDSEEDTLLVVEHVRSLLLWDKFRRLDLLEDVQREQIWLLEQDIRESLDERSFTESDDDDVSFEKE